MEEKEGHNYIFGKKIGFVLAKMDQRLQYESAMMSMALILIGMLTMTVYMDFYTSQTLLFKIMFTFNMICGMGLLGSFLVTQFQAYQNYMMIMDEMKLLNQPVISQGIIETTQQEKMKGGI